MWIIEENDRKWPIKVEYAGKTLDYTLVSDDLIDVDCIDPKEFYSLADSNFPPNIRVGIESKDLKRDSICWLVLVYRVNDVEGVGHTVQVI